MKLIQVTKEEFFKFVGPRDIITTIVGNWSQVDGYTTEWETRNRVLVGKSVGIFPNTKFYLTEKG